MKSTILCAALGAALILGGLPPVGAQTADPTATPAGSGKPGKPGKKDGKPPRDKGPFAGADISPDEAKRLAAAREKAEQDPTVRSLKEARAAVEQQLENAMSAAILSADPGLAPALERIKQARNRARNMRDKFESLDPSQKAALMKARNEAKDDPTVVAAREKMKAAKTPEQRREAGKAMHEAMKAAMTKANPELAKVLNELGPPPSPPPPGPHMGPPMGPPPGPGAPPEPPPMMGN
jgi:Spy/CpxP family protein refolding chaperone